VTLEALTQLDASELARLLRRREVSARDVVAAHLDQIERANPPINAIVTLCPERAMEAAAAADEVIVRSGPIGPLHGLPVAHKDLQDTAGLRTTYGSPIYADHIPETDSLLVERTRAAGAILVGKTNTPEFAAGSHTYNTVFGVTRNPFDLSRSAGGSSGGSAAALAARMVPLADGSDMGGSLRNPASFCNVVGFRPSAGLVPSWPSRNGWFTLAVDGALGRTVTDVALYLSVLAGFDARCPMAWPGDAIHFRAPGALDGDAKSLRVAWCPYPDGVVVDPSVTRVLETDGRPALEALGIDVVDLQPDLSGADASFRVLRAAHFAAAFGELYRTRRRDLNDMVAWNVEQGLTLRAADISAALESRTALYQRMAIMMRSVDALAMPVSQVPPFPAEERWVTEIDGHPQLTYLDWMRSCYLVSATGLPAVSVPCGFTADGLPVGIQLVGRPAGDLALLRLAHAVETATGAGRRAPVQ
jgi:amidase